MACTYILQGYLRTDGRHRSLAFPVHVCQHSDHKDMKIIAKRSNILQLSVFIYIFFKEKTDFDKPKMCFYHFRSNWDQLIMMELAIENSQ